jgi:hypothetical protein
VGSNAKRKTTRAKLNRETKLREKRAAKEARKVAREQEPSDGAESISHADEEYFGRLAEDPYRV